MNYKKTEIGKNITFTSVVDNKFNTCSLRITMITPMSSLTASDYSVAVNVLSDVNANLPTIAAMNERLSELYGAGLSSSSASRGDLHLLALSASWLADRFALDGENITAEMLKIVTDCLFNPLADENGFNEEIFRLSKKEILDIIDSQLNNKREYTVTKALQIAFEGEPAAVISNGTRESAEAVTPLSAYNAYKKLMETAQFDIIFISPVEMPEVAEIFKEKFADVPRKSSNYSFYAPSPLKSAPVVVKEEFDVLQAKIAFILKFDTDDIDAVHLMCIILGATPVSKLFMNVREKLSLCYYCACRMSEFKSSVIIDCGVEKNNIEKATDEIMNQLNEIRNGNISDEELQNALLAIENSYNTFGDSHGSYISWLFDCMCRDEYISPAEQIERFFAVTKERIIKAAENVKLDSTYHMLNKETEQ